MLVPKRLPLWWKMALFIRWCGRTTLPNGIWWEVLPIFDPKFVDLGFCGVEFWHTVTAHYQEWGESGGWVYAEPGASAITCPRYYKIRCVSRSHQFQIKGAERGCIKRSIINYRSRVPRQVEEVRVKGSETGCRKTSVIIFRSRVPRQGVGTRVASISGQGVPRQWCKYKRHQLQVRSAKISYKNKCQ